MKIVNVISFDIDSAAVANNGALWRCCAPLFHCSATLLCYAARRSRYENKIGIRRSDNQLESLFNGSRLQIENHVGKYLSEKIIIS